MKRTIRSITSKFRFRLPSITFRRSQSFYSTYGRSTPRITSNSTTLSDDDDDDTFQPVIDEPTTDDDRRESITLIPCEFCLVPQPSSTVQRHQILCNRNRRPTRAGHASPRITSSGRRRRAMSDEVDSTPSAPPRPRTPSPTEGLTLPAHLVCPITHELFRDPVVASDGHTYERSAILEWLRQSTTSPTTRATLVKDRIVPNLAIKNMVADFRAECQRQRLRPKYKLDIDVKKSETAPYIKTKTKSVYRAEWITNQSSTANSNIVLVHLTGENAQKIGDLYTRLPIHPNIVRVFGKVEHPDEGILLLQESLPEQTLAQLMENADQKLLPLKTRDLILCQIISAVQHLMNENYIYGYIKADNVFIYELDETPTNTLVKLNTIDSAEKLINGTPPENLSKNILTDKFCVYVFGLLAQELYSLDLEGDDADLTSRQTLYKSCLAEDPKDRPTFKKLTKTFRPLTEETEELFQSTSSE